MSYEDENKIYINMWECVIESLKSYIYYKSDKITLTLKTSNIMKKILQLINFCKKYELNEI